MFQKLGLIIVDNKDEGGFLETTSELKAITRVDDFTHLTPFSMHKASAATTNSSDAHLSRAAVANTAPAQLQMSWSCIQSELRLLLLPIGVLFSNQSLNASMFRPENSILSNT